MVTELSKPVRRRVGDLVVTIEADGIRLRRPGRRRSVLIPWKFCEEQFGDFLSGAQQTCRRAFQRPPPHGWCPRPGDRVFVGRVPGTLCGLVSRGLVIRVIEAVPEPMIRVQLRYGRATTEEMLQLAETRPLSPALWPLAPDTHKENQP